MSKAYVRISLLLLIVASTTGCGTIAPITTLLDIGEAVEAVEEDKKQPDNIETTVTKDGGKVTVQSDSDRSMVGVPTILQDQSPGFDIKKALDGVPTWLFIFNIILGFFVLINTWRSFYNNKKKAR